MIATWSLFHISLSSLASLAARETVSRVAAAGIPISIDAGSPLSIRSYGSVLTAALGNSKPAILFANEEEAAELTSTGLDRALSATQFIVKRGSAKTSLYDAAGVEISLNPEPVKVVDTTGAGDAFAAGFLSAHLRDARPEDFIDAAHAAAAAAIGIEGPGI